MYFWLNQLWFFWCLKKKERHGYKHLIINLVLITIMYPCMSGFPASGRSTCTN